MKMKYSVFSAFSRGYAHIKEDMPCQDYAAHYRDEQGRFAIAVACDGHSDKNCFRSDRGAKFGCEATIEVLKTFFESYYTLDEEERRRNLDSEDWQEKSTEMIKKYFIPNWNRKVQEDLDREPFTEENLAPLTQRVRDLYLAGTHTRDIYGATLQACAVCEDFHLVMQIGDGVILAAYPGGCYDEPLPEDEKSSFGSPASVCDEDLITRPEAFRIRIIPGIPEGMFASSDGMGEMSRLTFIYNMQNIQKKIAAPDDPEDGLKEIDEEQQSFIQEMVDYFAAKDHGPEDDCSIAGFVLRNAPIVPIRLKKEEAEQLIAVIDQRLEEEEKRIHAAEQNRSDYLRKYKLRISELESQRDRLKAELERVEAELAKLQQKVDEEEGGAGEKNRKILENLREQHRKAQEYLDSSRTEAGRPIPHGILADKITAEPAEEASPEENEPEGTKPEGQPFVQPQADPVDMPSAAEPQDKPEDTAPAEPTEEKKTEVEPVSSVQGEPVRVSENADKTENAEQPEDTEPAVEETKPEKIDPDEAAFPLPPEKLDQLGIQAAPSVSEPLVQQPVQQQPVQQPVQQPAQPPVQQSVQQPVPQQPVQQQPVPQPVQQPVQQPIPQPQDASDMQYPCVTENMYVVPDDQLLTP